MQDKIFCVLPFVARRSCVGGVFLMLNDAALAQSGVFECVQVDKRRSRATAKSWREALAVNKVCARTVQQVRTRCLKFASACS